MIKKFVALTLVLAVLAGFVGIQYFSAQSASSDNLQMAAAKGERKMYPNPYINAGS